MRDRGLEDLVVACHDAGRLRIVFAFAQRDVDRLRQIVADGPVIRVGQVGVTERGSGVQDHLLDGAAGSCQRILRIHVPFADAGGIAAGGADRHLGEIDGGVTGLRGKRIQVGDRLRHAALRDDADGGIDRTRQSAGVIDGRKLGRIVPGIRHGHGRRLGHRVMQVDGLQPMHRQHDVPQRLRNGCVADIGMGGAAVDIVTMQVGREGSFHGSYAAVRIHEHAIGRDGHVDKAALGQVIDHRLRLGCCRRITIEEFRAGDRLCIAAGDNAVGQRVELRLVAQFEGNRHVGRRPGLHRGYVDRVTDHPGRLGGGRRSLFRMCRQSDRRQYQRCERQRLKAITEFHYMSPNFFVGMK